MSTAPIGRSNRPASVGWRASTWFIARRSSSIGCALSPAPTTRLLWSRSPSASTDCCAARLYAGASTAAVVANAAKRNTTSDRPARYLMPRNMTVQAAKISPLDVHG